MKQPRVGRLVRNSLALIVSGAGSAAIGMVFWGVAAHLASATIVGRMSAEIAAMTLLAQLAQLSFGSIFERFLPVAGDQTRAFVKRAYTMCLTVALIIAAAYVVTGLGHTFLPSSLWWRLLFVFSVILWTIFMLQDSALVGLRASHWVPVENILYSLSKLALLPVLIVASADQGIFVAWMIPVVFPLIAVNLYLFLKRIPEHEVKYTTREKLPTVRELVLLSGAQYASMIVSVFSISITTLIVIDRLGAVANAQYYIPAQIAGGATILIASITRSFIVEASAEPHKLPHHARVTLWTSVAFLGSCVTVGIIFAPQILEIFGHVYATRGTTLLRMMLLSVPAAAVTTFYCAFAWLDKNVWWFAVRETASAAVFFAVLLAIIGHFGILAIGIAMLFQSGLQGVFFLPMLIRRYRQAVQLTD